MGSGTIVGDDTIRRALFVACLISGLNLPHLVGITERVGEGDETPEAIATSYDISVADVHAALAYAFSNPDEMREIEARNQAVSEETAANRIVPNDRA